MATDYWIDYSDPPYPAIRHRSYPLFDPEYNELMTLTAAKKEIKNRCRQERQHWLSVMNTQVDQTAETIIREANEARQSIEMRDYA